MAMEAESPGVSGPLLKEGMYQWLEIPLRNEGGDGRNISPDPSEKKRRACVLEDASRAGKCGGPRSDPTITEDNRRIGRSPRYFLEKCTTTLD